jgi:hypothetical protein
MNITVHNLKTKQVNMFKHAYSYTLYHTIREETLTMMGPIWAIFRLLRQEYSAVYVMMGDDRCTKV